MLSNEFEVLTPLRKLHRVSRKIANVATFESAPGLWLELTDAGVVPVTTAPAADGIYELSLSSAAKATDAISAYEANDTKLGRITTIVEPGARVLVGTGLISGVATVGATVAIDAAGKWVVAAAGLIVGKITSTNEGGIEIRLTETKYV